MYTEVYTKNSKKIRSVPCAPFLMSLVVNSFSSPNPCVLWSFLSASFVVNSLFL